MKLHNLTYRSKIYINIFSILSLSSFIIGLSSCSSGPTIQEFPDTANADQELKALDTDMSLALYNQVDALSPSNFKEAKESLENARKSLNTQRDPKTTLHQIAQSRAYLKRSDEVAALSHENMQEVVTVRQQAISSGANDLFAADFRKADEQLQNVTSAFEKNNVTGAEKHRAGIQAAYMALELRAIKQANLGQAKMTIDQAIKDGAKEYAPQNLAIAEKSYKDTEAYITANRHNVDEIKARSQKVNWNAEHLLKITLVSKNTKHVSPEELALEMESKQNKLVAKQNELNDEQSITQSLVKEKQALKEQNQSLESEKALINIFDQARREFTKDEAEVYKEGNSLIIRLRGLEFPSSQAVLKGSSFPLLGKVQRVIKEFGTPSVLIEGHTDSIGGKSINLKLSEDRAQAVREYFISNDAILGNKIQAIGYGYEKPLATNKTVAGRAQNRRVDVLIKPDKDQTQ